MRNIKAELVVDCATHVVLAFSMDQTAAGVTGEVALHVARRRRALDAKNLCQPECRHALDQAEVEDRGDDDRERGQYDGGLSGQHRPTIAGRK